jgi:HEAT repeat protein
MEAVMSTLEKIAFFQNRRDEVPNQLLARELAGTKNHEGIKEIVENLENKNKNVRSDCLKVLYEIGYLDPGLIAGYCNDFIKLLNTRDNRMVWGAMIALATIADRCPREIWARTDDIIRITDSGTVITLVWGIRVLARVAAADENYKEKIFPFLLKQIRSCIPRDLPTHTASMLCALDQKNKAEVLSILETRRAELTPAQETRLKKVLKQIEQISNSPVRKDSSPG